MKSRVVLISGANGALGQAIARAFLDEPGGNVVWLGVHRARDKAQRLAEEFATRCHCVDLDVRQAGSWEAAVNQVLARGERLDVLVNNAGKHADYLLATMPIDAWEDVVTTNLDGAFHGCRAVLPTMISQRGGAIVNVASLSALLAPAGQTNYAAAKAGVIALTQSLAKEVARLNITVNAVCPGYVETEGLAAMGPEKLQAARLTVPMRRFGRPQEIAAAIRFLASPEATYITGSMLKVDGGIF
jgi:3-oxoacyl-[acyl-carrier protein] reductase